MEYNSQQPRLLLPEYGRNVQKMVKYCCTIQDREERNRCARSIVDVMGQLNPHLRDVSDFKHKLWDHLFIMSDFQLDVESPYPKPDPEALEAKPERLQYPQKRIKYKHYGKYVEDFIKKCLEHTDPAQREEFTEAIGNLMKKNFLNWNRDSVNDEVVLDHLVELSNGQLRLKENTNLRTTQEILSKNKQHNNNNYGQNNNNNNHKHKKKFKRY